MLFHDDCQHKMLTLRAFLYKTNAKQCSSSVFIQSVDSHRPTQLQLCHEC